MMILRSRTRCRLRCRALRVDGQIDFAIGFVLLDSV